MDTELSALASKVNELLRAKGYTLSTAESCTGGAVAASITSVAGSSSVFKGAVVSYVNEIKLNVLNVSDEILKTYGAVSEATVCAMAKGVTSIMNTECAIATSGIAGPGGGTNENPVGNVWVCVSVCTSNVSRLFTFEDNGREANIRASVIASLEMLIELLLDN